MSLLAIPGMALVFLNQCWLGICLAVLSTRYRDIPPIVATVLQITVFATPIMWPVSSLGEKHFIADINPFYHLIEIVRGPLDRRVAAFAVMGSGDHGRCPRAHPRDLAAATRPPHHRLLALTGRDFLDAGDRAQ